MAEADEGRLAALERSLLAHDLILRSVLTHLAMTDPRGFEAMIGGFLNSNLYETPGSADLTRAVAEQLTRLSRKSPARFAAEDQGPCTTQASPLEPERLRRAVAALWPGEPDMKTNKAAVLASMVMAVGALGACSKPASETASDAKHSASDAASTGVNAAGGMADAGGAVSPPSSAQNEPINTDTNKTETAQTPGSSSFTEGQARGHIENAGYTDVTGLTKTADGFWTGSAKKDGKSVQVSVDYKGAVSAK